MRSLRRHHNNRRKARVMRMSMFRCTKTAPTLRQRGLWATSPKPCSCFFCGNARRFYGETIQERRALQRERWK